MNRVTGLFFNFDFTVGEDNGSRTAEPTPIDRNRVSFLLDSGLKVHVTSHLDDLSERRAINKKCTFRNRLHLRATVSRIIKLNVQDDGKEVEVRIKDVLQVLPCCLLRPDPSDDMGTSSSTQVSGRAIYSKAMMGRRSNWMDRSVS